jgi:hypothetical protein
VRPAPAFPLAREPGLWDALSLEVGTVYLETEGEPAEGKLAVAYVIENRLGGYGPDVATVILGRDKVAYEDGRPYEVFSCWNDDYRSQAWARLSRPHEGELEACWRAVAGARWQFLPDPSRGATHYLNVPLTKKIRGGDLPAWAVAAVARGPVVEIGRHTFLHA